MNNFQLLGYEILISNSKSGKVHHYEYVIILIQISMSVEMETIPAMSTRHVSILMVHIHAHVTPVLQEIQLFVKVCIFLHDLLTI